MNPQELVNTVKDILESHENQTKVESDFHQAMHQSMYGYGTGKYERT